MLFVAVTRHLITSHWWDTEAKRYQLVISEAVEAECERGDREMIERRRRLPSQVSLFPINY